METMKVIEFADKYLSPYNQKNSEIRARFCPYCKGGDKQDEYTFSINTDTLLFNCKRDTNCGKKGTFYKLCRDFKEKGEFTAGGLVKLDNNKKYKLPENNVYPLSQVAEKYLNIRGISRNTCDLMDIKSDKNNNILFKFNENNKFIFGKYRSPDENKKIWSTPDCKPIFYNMDNCKPELPLFIVEGEIDCLTLAEVGVTNATTIPLGAGNLDCIDNCWDWINQFETIMIFPDNDEAGRKLLDNISRRLGIWRCSVIKTDLKDANEVLLKRGKDELLEILNNPYPITTNIISIKDVPKSNKNNDTGASSGLDNLDFNTNGFILGEVSVWVGTTGSGKSTLLSQMLLESLNTGYNVCAYIGESTLRYHRDIVIKQLAGKDNFSLSPTPSKFTNKPYWFINDKETKTNKMYQWCGDKYYLINTEGAISPTELLELFEYATRRYDVKIFLVDNIMSMRGYDEDYQRMFRQQGEFITRLVTFARDYDVHIHIVSHTRKTDKQISGTAEISNRAFNIFSITRVDGDNDYNAMLEILKCRSSGVQNLKIGLKFDTVSKRFTMADNELGFTKKYGWEVQNYEKEML
jgi:5S rRNA maturation endonuclease (ribonuclease M5)/KaiC/GvpD/RAD55 family RecA-like ATPase